jgi:hypothetical protein
LEPCPRDRVSAKYTMKICSKCQQSKDYIEFYRHPQMGDGYLNKCKECAKKEANSHRLHNLERIRQKDRDRHTANPEKKRSNARRYRAAHIEECTKRATEWAKKNPEAKRAIQMRYNKNNPGHKTRYEKERIERDPVYAMVKRLRHRVHCAIRAANGKKATNTIDLIGCTPHQLKEHLESLFKPAMSWANRHRWHIDHKRPCASFDLADTEQQFECFHYTNLQPLWAEDNLRKGDDFPF